MAAPKTAAMSNADVAAAYATLDATLVGKMPPDEKETAGLVLALIADAHLTLKRLAEKPKR